MSMSSSNSISGCRNDDLIGPAVVGCRGDFDFTAVFEQSFLSIAPSALFVVLAALRIGYLIRKPQVVLARTFQSLKLVSDVKASLFFSLCFSLLGF